MNTPIETPAKPGSSIYYSLLYSEGKIRKQISTLYDFYQTLQEIPLHCQNKELAQIKYQWWNEEVNRIETKNAQHPVAKSLQTMPFSSSDLQSLLHAFIKDMQLSLYEEETRLHHYYQNTAGLRERMICRLYDIQEENILQQAENAGIFIDKVLHLKKLRQHILQGKIYFSGESLLLHRTNLYELSQLTLTENIRALLEDEAQKIYTLPSSIESVPLFTKTLTYIHLALLKEIINSHFPIFTHNIHLTPLRKWWIAWKTKRR